MKNKDKKRYLMARASKLVVNSMQGSVDILLADFADDVMNKFGIVVDEFLDPEAKYLKELGFKKKWLSDGSGYWMQRKAEGRFLGKCKLVVETFEERLVIYVSKRNSDGNLIDVIELDYTRDLCWDVLGYVEEEKIIE